MGEKGKELIHLCMKIKPLDETYKEHCMTKGGVLALTCLDLENRALTINLHGIFANGTFNSVLALSLCTHAVSEYQ